MFRTSLIVVLLCGLFAFVGCKSQQESASSPPSAEAQKYLLASAPEGAVDVIQAREKAQTDDEVVVVGRIGGSHDPWINGQAAFTIVDPSLKACSDIEGDNCPTPWDYCCETDKLKTGTALVKLVDDQGNSVKTDAKDFLKVKELATVVVRGKAVRDETGNLTVLASGLHVRP